MKKLIQTILLCSGFTSTWAGALSLEDAINENIRKHPQVTEQLKNFNAINEDVEIAKAGYLPTLNLRSGVGYEKYRNNSSNSNRENDVSEARIILKQNLFNGFGTRNDVQRNKDRRSVAAYRYLEQADFIAFETIEKYITLLKHKALINLAQKNVDTQLDIFANIRKKVDSGVGKTSELDRAAGRLAAAQSNYMTHQNNYKEAAFNFHKLQGRFVDSDNMVLPVFNHRLLPANLDESLKQLFANHPSLHIAARNIDVQKSTRKFDKKGYYPTIDFELSKEWKNDIDGIDGHTNDLKAMVYLNWNLFNGNADKARQRKGASQINREYDFKNKVKRDLVNNLQLVWSGHRLLKQQQKFLARNETLMRKVLKSYHVEFRLAQRRLINVLDAEIEYYQSRVNVVENDYDLLISQYRLLYSMGTLVNRVNKVSLPVKISRAVHDIQIAGQAVDVLPIATEQDRDKVLDDVDICTKSLGGVNVGSSGCNKIMASQYLTDVVDEEQQLALGRKEIKDKQDLELKKLKLNEVVLLDYLNFDHNALEFSRSSKNVLRSIIKQLRDFGKNVLVEATVYSQDNRDKIKDKILSVRRGYNLKKVLIKNGINLDNIIVYGESVVATGNKPENYLKLKIIDRFEYVQDNYESIVNEKISFKRDSIELPRHALRELKSLSQQIRQLGNIEVNLISYSNDYSSVLKNRDISVRRAQRLEDILRENGVVRALIVPFGSGSFDPIDYDIYSQDSENMNLVEVVVKKKPRAE
ncbi:MAG: TolC family outer membrane protein [Desulfobulbaceae bacterium]|nr:TolC family outer membrane protein [Desulfobulbaceae bacterium]